MNINQKHLSVTQLFEDLVLRYGKRIALACENREYSYTQLNEWANQLAHYIRAQCGETPQAVALLFSHTEYAIVSMLAVLKSGHYYVPIDASFPPQKIHAILEDCNATVLLTSQDQQALTTRLTETLDRPLFICNVEDGGVELPKTNPGYSLSPSALAYIIYTSGSTGKPKGVVHNHAYITWLTHTYTNSGQINCEDRLALLYSPAFAGAVRDIFCTLLNGATLLTFDIKQHDMSALRTWLIEQKVSVVFFVATLFRHFCRSLSDNEPAPPLRLIEIGSEPVYFYDAEIFQQHFSEPCKFIVNFGGSEISPVTQLVIDKNSPITNPLSVGKPVKGVQVYIIDENKHILPDGSQGEIVICSEYLALGYWQKSELSAASFAPANLITAANNHCGDTDSIRNDQRCYYSGDMGMLQGDGNLIHLGRKDFQLKIRGYRVETSEVESALLTLDYIREAVVSAAADHNGDNFLLVYAVPDECDDSISLARIRSDLATVLPEYMIPSKVIPISAVPLTDTGKINRLALPKPQISQSRQADYAEDASSELERNLSVLWAQLFNLPSVSVKDNFFELGGHSLLALQLRSRIQTHFGLEIPLAVIFNTPILKDLASIIHHAQNDFARVLSFPTAVIKALHHNSPVPLSFAQQRMWFLTQLDGESQAYNMCRAFHLKGQLNIEALRLALTSLTKRHLILRCSFPAENGQATVRVNPPYDALHIFERDDTGDEIAEQQHDTLLSEFANQPFELHTGPLLRTMLVKKQLGESIFLLNMHHIISDDWSMRFLLQELSQLYRAFDHKEEPVLALLPIQYPDYAAWQREWLQGTIFEQQLTYWQSQLQNSPALLELPTDTPRPAVKSYQGACYISRLPSRLHQQLEFLSQKHGLTLFMSLLAAFTLLLSRYSRQKDICVGTPIFNRSHPHTEELIGLFVNSLVIRNQIDDQQTCSDFLQQVRQTCLDAYSHQDIPFESLVEAVNPERSLSHSPLYQVMFSLQNTGRESLALSGIEAVCADVGSPTAKFDLVLEVFVQNDGLTLSWEYATDLFAVDTIARMAGHFEVLLQGLADNPAQPVCQLPLMTEAEIEQQVTEPVLKAYDKHETLAGRFLTQAKKWPLNTAVMLGEQGLSYRELNEQANQLAHYLIDQGVRPNTLVGICMEKSCEMIVSILGVIKASGAYVPIDPQHPQERLHTIIDDSKVSLLLVNKSSERFDNCACTLVEVSSNSFNRYPISEPEISFARDDLAYVIYTSGSTGRPKGCQISHANVLRLFDSTEALFEFSEKDVWTLFHSFAFDFSVWEIWGALLHGGRLVLVPYMVSRAPDEFHRLLVHQHVTILNQTPSAFYQLSEVNRLSGDKLSLRHIIFGGESLDSTALKPWFNKHGDQSPQLSNMYGITETTVHVTYCPLSAGEEHMETTPPRNLIGTPLPDLQVHLLDESQQSVPVGIAGEIHVAGPGVSRGYLNRPSLTAERFIELEINGRPQRLYKSGDMARRLPDGNLEYLGRIDQQIQLRGFRIEPGEIEARLNQHPAVCKSLVLSQGEHQDKRLQAYVIPDPVTAAPLHALLQLKREDTLNKALLHELPNGMTVTHLNKSETEFVYEEIFSERHYLRHGITLEKDACVFDVGANIGLFSLFIASECPNATLYAFEPLPPIFEKLKLNSLIHEVNIKLFNCGLSDQRGSDVFTFYPHVSVISGRFADKGNEHELVKTFMNRQLSVAEATSNEHSPDTRPSNKHLADSLSSDALLDELLTQRLESQQYTCQFRTLSDVMAEQGVEKIDLLKVDVEKSELDVLSGINEEDWYKIDQLVVEVHDGKMQSGQSRLAFITTLLKAKGYTVTVEQEDLLQDTSLYNIYAHKADTLVNKNQGKKPDTQKQKPAPAWRSLYSLRKELREYLKQSLPEYMVPSGIIALNAFPLTPNGKVDQQALRHIENVQTVQHVAPRTAIEKQLVSIWSEVLTLNSKKVNDQKSQTLKPVQREPDQLKFNQQQADNHISIHDTFFDLGGHSLLMTHLILKINEFFNCNLTLKVFYECQTIASMATFITSQDANPTPSISTLLLNDATLSAWNVNLHNANTVTAIEKNKKVEKNTGTAIDPNTVSPASKKKILLTGANGFVGVHLLQALLNQSDAVVYCLTRADDAHHALNRLRSAYQRYGLNFPETSKRIVALAGDLSADRLGLDAALWSTLSEELDAIYHNGAQVHHLYPYQVLRKTNVQSVANIIALARQGSKKSIHYISTLSVARKEKNSNTVNETHLDKNQPPIQASGYVQSKWVAELLLQDAITSGIPVTIYRLGQITGHSITGACKVADDNFLSLVKGCLQMGFAPKTGRPVQLMPVDVASRLVSGLSHQVNNANKVFHINNHQGLSWEEYLSWYQGLGYTLNLLPIEQWLTKLERIDDDNVLMPLVLYYTDPHYRESLQIMKNTCYDNSNTQARMAEFGEQMPMPDQLKTPYLDFLKDSNYLTGC